jgi:hypothetical protein
MICSIFELIHELRTSNQISIPAKPLSLPFNSPAKDKSPLKGFENKVDYNNREAIEFFSSFCVTQFTPIDISIHSV